MWSLLSGQDPASSLDCLTVLLLEYQSTENKLPCLPQEPVYLLPQNQDCHDAIQINRRAVLNGKQNIH